MSDVPWYDFAMATKTASAKHDVIRAQTGIRMERRILKVLKATAELKDMSVGDLLEGILLYAFEGKPAFATETLKQIQEFRNIYGLTLTSSDSQLFKERKRG